MTDLRVALAHKHAETIYRGARDVAGDLLAWDALTTSDQRAVYALMDPLLPVIAAHEAEVVGRILDRIDALHAGIDALNVRARPHGRVVQVCVACGTDDGNWRQHPCPTRRLTAEIRGEMSHD